MKMPQKSVKETFPVSATWFFEISTPKIGLKDMLPTFNTKCKLASHFQILLPDYKDKDLYASTCLIDSVLWGEQMAGSTAAAQCAFAGDAPQVEWPRRYPMCTFPVMIPKFPFKSYFQSMWAS